MSNFRITQSCGGARAGELITAHGVIPTPVFMPVGSQATVKTLTPEEVETCGYNMLLSNTYHLYLRPGAEVIQCMGGLHRFMGWPHVILTDSGGYQIFSLSALSKITDEGVTFRSHLDGSSHSITPEKAVELQEKIGADVIMVLDEPSFADTPLEKVRQAMERTHRWAMRCQQAQTRTDQQLFAIVQGGFNAELRRESADYLAGLNFTGYAIGGLSLGEPKEVTWDILGQTTVCMPAAKPRYLMGVGSPEDFVTAVSLGVDMLDCALPTRVARNGALFTLDGRINIDNAAYREQQGPIEEGCDCYTCSHFSAAYVNHLFRAGEILGLRLASIHNLRFMARLMRETRQAILDGSFASFQREFLTRYHPTNETVRLAQKQKWLKTRQSQQE